MNMNSPSLVSARICEDDPEILIVSSEWFLMHKIQGCCQQAWIGGRCSEFDSVGESIATVWGEGHWNRVC